MIKHGGEFCESGCILLKTGGHKMNFNGKVAIVTGAGQGIGRAIALKLADHGARICIAEIDSSNGEKVAQEIRAAGGSAIVVTTDITDYSPDALMAKKTFDAFGQIDILVNNAGWDKVEPFINNTLETWEKVIAINFKGPVYSTKAVLPYMMERNYGKILNVASDAGRVGSSGEAVYSGAKGGVIAFSKTMAREVSRYKINVNSVCPGPTETQLFEEIAAGNPKIAEGLKRAIPLRRLGKPEDIANAVAFMVSDEAEYITGQTLSVSGGLTMA